MHLKRVKSFPVLDNVRVMADPCTGSPNNFHSWPWTHTKLAHHTVQLQQVKFTYLLWHQRCRIRWSILFLWWIENLWWMIQAVQVVQAVWVDHIHLWWRGVVSQRKPCHTHSLAWDQYWDDASPIPACQCPRYEGSSCNQIHHDQQMNTPDLCVMCTLRWAAHGVVFLLYVFPARSPGRDQKHSELISVCLFHHHKSLVCILPIHMTSLQLGLHSAVLLGMPSLIQSQRLDPSSRTELQNVNRTVALMHCIGAWHCVSSGLLQYDKSNGHWEWGTGNNAVTCTGEWDWGHVWISFWNP